MPQGVATFASIPYLLGGTLTLSRGVRPSKCLLRKSATTPIGATYGTLQISYGGTVAATLSNCALANVSNRNWHGRDGWLQDLIVLDRRWKWKHIHVSGTYNQRALNGEIQSKNKKNIKQLIEIVLTALGETSYDVSSVPTDVYPPVYWRGARADLELQWLCDLVGMTVCPVVSSDTFSIKKINDPSGSSLPAGGTPVTNVYQFKPSVMPSYIGIQGGETIIQSKLTLSAVGLESDGKIEILDDLTYKPASGWGTQWYDSFAGVNSDKRHLAFRTVWRWYRPDGGWDSGSFAPNSADDIEMLETCAECCTTPEGWLSPLPPVVTGVFWPLGDKNENTSSTARYVGNFRILSDINVVEFEYPVIKWSSGIPAEPDLDITIAYKLKQESGSGSGSGGAYDSYTRTKAVSSSTVAGGTSYYSHPELTKVILNDVVYGGAVGDNATALNAEADSYLNNIETKYDFTYANERVYNGLIAQNLDGAISQVQWFWGNGRTALTRIGQYTTVDQYSVYERHQAAMDRLYHMAAMQGV